MTLVIMAAGMGSRYGGLKQMDPMGPNGEFILDYSVYDAVEAGFDRIVFLIKKELLNDFKNTVGNRISGSVKVDYAFQELEAIPHPEWIPKERTKPWGTAHAVLSCEHLVKDNFAVINADDFYGKEAFKLLAKFLKNTRRDDKSHYCMVGYQLVNTLTSNGHVARGICEADQNGNLLSITERTKIQMNGGKIEYTEDEKAWTPLPSDSIASLNCWGFTPDLFPEIRKGLNEFLEQNKNNLTKAEFFLPSVVDSLMEENYCDVKILTTGEKWYGVTYHEDKEEFVQFIKSQIKAGKYPENLWKS